MVPFTKVMYHDICNIENIGNVCLPYEKNILQEGGV